MGPTRTKSLGGKKYIMVMVSDFTRFTWVIMLWSKSEAPHHIELLCKRVQNEKRIESWSNPKWSWQRIQKFLVRVFLHKCWHSSRIFSSISPQRNGVVERKNKVSQEMAIAMLHNKDVAKDLWGEAINTACHIVNWVYFRPGTKKTPYELWKGRKTNVKYFRILVAHSKGQRECMKP